MRPSHLSYAFLSAFLSAIFFLQWYASPAYPWHWYFVLGLFGIFGIFFSQARILIPITLGVIAALLIVSHTTHVASSTTIDFYASSDEEIAIRGIVTDDPDRRPHQTIYVIDVTSLRQVTGMQTVGGRVQVTVRSDAGGIEYGDEVIARGTLQLPDERNGSGFKNFLSRNGIYSTIAQGMITKTGRNLGNPLMKMLLSLRHGIEDSLNQLLPEPHASLLAGLLLGSKRQIPQELLDDFKTTGLTHIIAISGFNITMLVTVIGGLLFWLPLKWRIAPAVLLIVGFTLLTGASASAVRAAVMGILGLIAIQSGRIQSTRLSVLWSAALMLSWNPQFLWYDAGFQLSFLALIGVLEIAPLFQPYLQWLPEILGIRESLCLTLAAQSLASPWILFLFGQLSLIAPVSNLLAPPVVAYAMLFGTMSVMTGWIWFPLGRIVAVIAWLPLQWIIGVTETLAALPFAAVQTTGIATLWIVLYYGVLAAWVITNDRRTRSVPLSTAELL